MVVVAAGVSGMQPRARLCDTIYNLKFEPESIIATAYPSETA